MQRFQTLPGDFENALAIRSAVAYGLEVVFEAGENFGQTLHLIAVGNSLRIDQLGPRVGIHRIDVCGHRSIFKNGERAGNLFQQSRDDRELLMVPVAFDERDVRLPDLHEIDDGFADERVQQLMRLR